MKKRNKDIKHEIQNLQVERILNMSDDEIMVEAIWEYGSPANAQKAINHMCNGINTALAKHGIKPIKFKAATELEHFKEQNP